VEEGAPIDHRGRSKPLYTPRSGNRPHPLSRWARLVYGVFPGLRTMALDDFQAGAPIAGLGVVVAAVGIFLFSSLDVTIEVLRRIDADPSLLMVQVALIWVMVLAFEGLRLGSSGLDRMRGPRAPRILATLCLPAGAVVVGTLAEASLIPRLNEALFVFGVLAFIATWPAVAFCIADAVLPASGSRDRWERTVIIIAASASVAALAWLVLWPHPEWAQRASWIGWTKVSALLS
jgi:hypothetical protein